MKMDIRRALEAVAADAANGTMVFPSNAELALRVQRELENPDCSFDQVSKLIAAEPVLSARVLGIANSLAYNASGRASSDVRQAVSRLGIHTLHILVTAVLVRQMENMAQGPAQRSLATRLWEHTAHVAALARVIAQRLTGHDPDQAFFAGIVHEVGGFYLISRASRFPGLFDDKLPEWDGEPEAAVGRAVLRLLGVPEVIVEAVEIVWGGYLAMPPKTLGDTLLLADQLAPVESPLTRLAGKSREGLRDEVELAIDDATLSGILAESAAEVASLTAALRG
jgi:HD-like signal output (HDOD) protein